MTYRLSYLFVVVLLAVACGLMAWPKWWVEKTLIYRSSLKGEVRHAEEVEDADTFAVSGGVNSAIETDFRSRLAESRNLTLEVAKEAVSQRDEAERRFNRLAVKALAAGLIDGPDVLGFPFKTINGRPFVKVMNSEQWNELEWPSHDDADHIDLYYGNHPDKRVRAIYLNGQWYAVVIEVEPSPPTGGPR